MSPFLQLMRFDKPAGTYLLLWPTLSALWFASKGTPHLKLLSIFILGVIVTRAAGCVLNDILDRNFDRHIARTKNRPLATGQLSLKSAFFVLFFLSTLACSLLFFLNTFSVLLAIVAAGLTALYPLMKRFMNYPQYWLGITWNMGILIAFSATQNTLPLAAWVTYFLGILLTIAYDTLYAMADAADDLKIAIKSTALTWHKHAPLIVSGLYAVVFITLLMSGFIASLGWPYFIGLFSAIGWIIHTLKPVLHNPSPTLAFAAFKQAHVALLFIFLGIMLQYLVL